jgi:dihydrofolate reductase
MGKTIMGAVVSLDGFIADDDDSVGPLFDWYSNGDVTWSFPGSDDEFRTTQGSAEFMRSQYRDVAAVVIGRRLFDLTNGSCPAESRRPVPSVRRRLVRDHRHSPKLVEHRLL